MDATDLAVAKEELGNSRGRRGKKKSRKRKRRDRKSRRKEAKRKERKRGEDRREKLLLVTIPKVS
jgi:hypothetical protein